MRRGELWIGSGGAPYAGKPRPMLIVQHERFDSTDSITICPTTTTVTDLQLFRVPLSPTEQNGLHENCEIMADKISTIPRTKLDKRIGTISAEQVVLVERALLVFLGMDHGD